MGFKPAGDDAQKIDYVFNVFLRGGPRMASPVILTLVALLACCLPPCRAATVDPAETLRLE
jgi:ABC-type lipoprotein release transport system permease subunit